MEQDFYRKQKKHKLCIKYYVFRSFHFVQEIYLKVENSVTYFQIRKKIK